jgi:exodeoxyribonuclease-3
VLVATWNVNSLNARLPRVEDWLQQVQPDVLCLQETKLADDAFPALAFSALGYESVHHGEGRWNGVAILSRVGIDDPIDGFAAGIEADSDARLVSATCGGVRIHSVYVPNGREVGHDHYHYKLSWLARLRRHLEATVDPSDDVVVTGDFNIAPTDADVWDRAVFEGATHVTEPERDALAEVLAWGLVDTFRERHPVPKMYSYYDYQAGRFHKREGIRIDFVLSSRPLAERCVFDVVDRNGRKGTKPSDHCPVVAVYRDEPPGDERAA